MRILQGPQCPFPFIANEYLDVGPDTPPCNRTLAEEFQGPIDAVKTSGVVINALLASFSIVAWCCWSRNKSTRDIFQALFGAAVSNCAFLDLGFLMEHPLGTVTGTITLFWCICTVSFISYAVFLVMNKLSQSAFNALHLSQAQANSSRRTTVTRALALSLLTSLMTLVACFITFENTIVVRLYLALQIPNIAMITRCNMQTYKDVYKQLQALQDSEEVSEDLRAKIKSFDKKLALSVKLNNQGMVMLVFFLLISISDVLENPKFWLGYIIYTFVVLFPAFILVTFLMLLKTSSRSSESKSKVQPSDDRQMSNKTTCELGGTSSNKATCELGGTSSLAAVTETRPQPANDDDNDDGHDDEQT